ncbi:MAG: TRAP transporter small permease, partial [Dehalococcoidales bacterium]|nr:TRAP transporter small permease [Dehalococcoidales bacterium]
LGFTQFKKSNVSVDIIFVKFPIRVQNILNIFTCLLCLAISALMLRQSLLYNIYLSEINRKSVILQIPISPIQVVMVIGFAVLCLVLLVQLIDYTRKAVKG